MKKTNKETASYEYTPRPSKPRVIGSSPIGHAVSPCETGSANSQIRADSGGNSPHSSPINGSGKLNESSVTIDRRVTRLLSLTFQEIEVIRGKLLGRSSQDENGCQVWEGAKTQSGYGSMLARPKGWVESTHVLSMFVFNGIAVPSTLVINHRCENKLCVHPGHLQQATVRENSLYSDTEQSRNAAKTHCAEGHEYAGGNVRITPRGRRICVTCHRKWRRESAQRAADKNNPNRNRQNRAHLRAEVSL